MVLDRPSPERNLVAKFPILQDDPSWIGWFTEFIVTGDEVLEVLD
jgi:hypothetical protein